MKPRYRSLSASNRTKILNRDNHTCQDCGVKFWLQIHHIKPQLDGGDDSDNNLITLCKPCHEKADKEHKSKLVKAARARYFEQQGVVSKNVISVRVTTTERAQIEALADQAGMTVSDFIREKIGL